MEIPTVEEICKFFQKEERKCIVYFGYVYKYLIQKVLIAKFILSGWEIFVPRISCYVMLRF